MTRFGTIPLYPWQGLAWQIDPWSSKKTGFLPSRTAFGHTGWTGTSMWMDRSNGLFATRIPSNEEVIEHNHNGLLVPVEDPMALAESIELLLIDLAVVFIFLQQKWKKVM